MSKNEDLTTAVIKAVFADSDGTSTTYDRVLAVLNQSTPNVMIVPSPRPTDDGSEAWQRMLAHNLDERRRANFLTYDFVECDTCAAKPGSPSLCAGCLANRLVIERLRTAARAVLEVSDRRTDVYNTLRGMVQR